MAAGVSAGFAVVCAEAVIIGVRLSVIRTNTLATFIMTETSTAIEPS
jgi:hypothetical protein